MAEQTSSILDAFKHKQSDTTVVDTGKKVKVAIIGTGWIAEAHVAAYKTFPDVEIVAAADLIPGKAEKFCQDNGLENVRLYGHHTELIEAEKGVVDAVSICVYNTQHAPVAVDCLHAGFDVLLEKPFTVTLAEALDVMRAEKASGQILSIGFQPRFDANMQMIKKIVESGELGKVYYVQTGGGRRRGIPTPFGTSFIEAETGGIGALADIGCYSLDVVLNALGNPKPLTVSGYVSNYFGKNPEYFTSEGKPAEYADLFGVDDFGAAFVRLEGDIILDFRIAWAMHLDTPGDTIFMGTKGSLRVPSTESWNGSFDEPLTLYKDVAGEGVTVKVPLKRQDGDVFELKCRSFIDAVKTRGTAPIPSHQILFNQAIIDGINRSSELGREIVVEIPEI